MEVIVSLWGKEGGLPGSSSNVDMAKGDEIDWTVRTPRGELVRQIKEERELGLFKEVF